MTTLAVIHTKSMRIQRIHANTIGPAYYLPAECQHATIEDFRKHGYRAPVPRTRAELVFDSMVRCIAI